MAVFKTEPFRWVDSAFLLVLVSGLAGADISIAHRLPTPSGIHIATPDSAVAQPTPAGPHEYVRQFGEAYSYDPVRHPLGFLLLKRTSTEIVFADVVVTQDGYTATQFENCDLVRHGCRTIRPAERKSVVVPSTDDDAIAPLLRDATAGRLLIFSRARALLAHTPW